MYSKLEEGHKPLEVDNNAVVVVGKFQREQSVVQQRFPKLLEADVRCPL